MKNAQIGKELIEQLEKARQSKVIAYFTGDRHPFGSRIAEDAVRPLYDHLLALKFDEGAPRRIDMFLYTRGGDVSVPWRVVSMIREFCDEFNVLIPYRAQSAGTLLSLGADSIIMGKKAELSPIDPTLSKTVIGETAVSAQEIAVEDVNSFLSFIKDRANINDQDAVAQILNSLINQIEPLTLGRVNRQHQHIRLVARKLLTSRKEKTDEEKIATIIETLTEKMFSHGHGIGRKEARDIGLPVVFAEEIGVEDLMWELYLNYEEFLKLRDPIYPQELLENSDNYEIREMPVAVIESVEKLHVFRINVKLKVKRAIPSNPQININLGLQLPPQIQPQQIPQVVQQMLNQMVSQVIPQVVREEIMRQSPIEGIKAEIYGGRWYEER